MTAQRDVDRLLWVELDGVPGRCFLTGNCHTFPGRMNVWSDELGRSLCTSASEVVSASPHARSWIDGFLAGNEPAAAEMFGPSMSDAPDDDPRWERWNAARAEFRRTGVWPHGSWCALLPFPPGLSLPTAPWAVRGDEVWVWDGDRWTVADPQPARTFGLLDGSVCAERRHHDLQMVSTAHAVCIDCGAMEECVPDGFTAEAWERERYTYVPALLAPGARTAALARARCSVLVSVSRQAVAVRRQ